VLAHSKQIKTGVICNLISICRVLGSVLYIKETDEQNKRAGPERACVVVCVSPTSQIGTLHVFPCGKLASQREGL
jgi:hypothetical protein